MSLSNARMVHKLETMATTDGLSYVKSARKLTSARDLAQSPTKTQSNVQIFYSDSAKFDSENGWSEQIEKDAKEIGERCSGMKWMHDQSANTYKKYYWGLIAIDITLAALLVAFNSITGAQCINDNWNGFRITSIVLSALGGIVTTISGVMNYGAKVSAHQFAEGNFQALFYTIRTQLHKSNKRDRQNGGDFLEWIQKEYNDLTSNPDAPDIPNKIQKAYEKLIADINIARVGDIETIQIIKSIQPQESYTIVEEQNDRKPSRTYSTTGRTGKYKRERKQIGNNNDINENINLSPYKNNRDNDDVRIYIPDGLTEKEKYEISRFLNK